MVSVIDPSSNSVRIVRTMLLDLVNDAEEIRRTNFSLLIELLE